MFVFGVFNDHGAIFPWLRSIIGVEVISCVLRYPDSLMQNGAGSLEFLLCWFVNLSVNVLLYAGLFGVDTIFIAYFKLTISSFLLCSRGISLAFDHHRLTANEIFWYVIQFLLNYIYTPLSIYCFIDKPNN